MLKIDQKTGLPELPEDMFWRVESPFKNNSNASRFSLENLFAVRLMRKIPTGLPEVEYVTTIETKVRYSMWRGKESTYKVETKTKKTNPQFREIEVHSAHMYETRTGRKPDEGFVNIHGNTELLLNYNQKTTDRKWFLPSQLTDENVLEFASKCWKDYIECCHAKAFVMDNERVAQLNRSRILGDYPPNSIRLGSSE